MLKDSPAKKATLADPPKKFYVQKKNVRPMIAAIVKLQERTDISGKFSRKIGQNRRALSNADEVIIEDRKALTLQHAEKFPEKDKDGNAHPKAGEPTPVFATKPDGSAIYKQDEKGNDTEERQIIPDQYHLANPQLFGKEFQEMLDEYIVVECPGFTEDDWNSFKQITAGIVDPLMDLDPAGDCVTPPKSWEDEKPALALVDDEPIGAASETEEERSAP